MTDGGTRLAGTPHPSTAQCTTLPPLQFVWFIPQIIIREKNLVGEAEASFLEMLASMRFIFRQVDRVQQLRFVSGRMIIPQIEHRRRRLVSSIASPNLLSDRLRRSASRRQLGFLPQTPYLHLTFKLSPHSSHVLDMRLSRLNGSPVLFFETRLRFAMRRQSFLRLHTPYFACGDNGPPHNSHLRFSAFAFFDRFVDMVHHRVSNAII